MQQRLDVNFLKNSINSNSTMRLQIFSFQCRLY